MDDFLPVISYFSRYIALTPEEEDFVSSLLKKTKVKKRHTIVQPGDISRYRSYVVKGSMRAYIIDEKGNEHTIALAIEDWWIGDYSSYIFQEPATFYVEALEDTVLIQLERHNENLLLESNAKFQECFRIMTERTAAALQKRMVANLSMSAEQRFEQFAQKYPLLMERIPQYLLASYLGFSAEFLSRLRSSKAKK